MAVISADTLTHGVALSVLLIPPLAGAPPVIAEGAPEEAERDARDALACAADTRVYVTEASESRERIALPASRPSTLPNGLESWPGSRNSAASDI